jgi:hypothetical protein
MHGRVKVRTSDEKAERLRKELESRMSYFDKNKSSMMELVSLSQYSDLGQCNNLLLFVANNK